MALWLVLIALAEPRASVRLGVAWNHNENLKNVSWASAGSQQQLQELSGLLLQGREGNLLTTTRWRCDEREN